ncbi:MAG: ribonucleotide-diphosphate reductase subunit alpha [Candidatus Zixiibacteriota bacterium]|nr:MAG: ribonucleotide-diphosphate reductase subunit alpha [candidate division Zixibacteria bacterium]
MSQFIEPKISDNALTVLKRRYLIRDKQGRTIETVKELFLRVANFIADADKNYGADQSQIEQTAGKFYNMMAELDFMPNSPTLMNAGKDLGQLSACFVLPVGDSMEEIFETNKDAALIHKTGGGTGFSFSRLRPKDSIVASTSGVASGPVSFMKVFNASTEAVKQGGTRRGANMGVLRVDHPDILEFISCKDNTDELKNFNISVAITDSFMKAFKNKTDFPLIDPCTGEVHTIESDGNKIEIRINAEELFDEIVEHAWQTGEPGLIFIDRMNELNPTYPTETIEATNPCGEQPLSPYDSCNLGSVNLGRFVKEKLPDNYSSADPSEGIDWVRLGKIIRDSVHFLDNVIDQNKYPLEKIKKQTLKNRRIGLGVMGWADMLVKLKVPYNSQVAFELAEKVMEFVKFEARKHSSELAKTRGKFPNWENSVFAKENIAMRNCALTTIAPTGTISIIAGCSSGIEPYYAIAFERNVLDGSKLTELNQIFEKSARSGNFYSDILVKKIKQSRSLKDIDEIPNNVKAVFLTSFDINPQEHIMMQAMFQKHCDSSVSKTINLPEAATVADVKTAYISAYENGCKGVTVYRDKSRPEQVLTTGEISVTESSKLKIDNRPTILSGFTEKIKTGYGNLYVTVNLRNGIPFEVFAHIGKSGYSTMADTEGICRLISLALRAGVDVKQIIRQLRGIGGSSQIYSQGSKISSIPDAIAQILHRHFEKDMDNKEFNPNDKIEMCPECSGNMIFSSGCFSCQFCGYSNC